MTCSMLRCSRRTVVSDCRGVFAHAMPVASQNSNRVVSSTYDASFPLGRRRRKIGFLVGGKLLASDVPAMLFGKSAESVMQPCRMDSEACWKYSADLRIVFCNHAASILHAGDSVLYHC